MPLPGGGGLPSCCRRENFLEFSFFDPPISQGWHGCLRTLRHFGVHRHHERAGSLSGDGWQGTLGGGIGEAERRRKNGVFKTRVLRAAGPGPGYRHLQDKSVCLILFSQDVSFPIPLDLRSNTTQQFTYAHNFLCLHQDHKRRGAPCHVLTIF